MNANLEHSRGQILIVASVDHRLFPVSRPEKTREADPGIAKCSVSGAV